MVDEIDSHTRIVSTFPSSRKLVAGALGERGRLDSTAIKRKRQKMRHLSGFAAAQGNEAQHFSQNAEINNRRFSGIYGQQNGRNTVIIGTAMFT